MGWLQRGPRKNLTSCSGLVDHYMSKLAKFRQLEKHLAEQLQALETLKGDAGLKQEIEFETKLRALLAKWIVVTKSKANTLLTKKKRSENAPLSGLLKPSIVQAVPVREWIFRINTILGDAGNPCTTRNLRNHCINLTSFCSRNYAAFKDCVEN